MKCFSPLNMIQVNSTFMGLAIDIDNPLALLGRVLILNHCPFPVLGHHPFPVLIRSVLQLKTNLGMICVSPESRYVILMSEPGESKEPAWVWWTSLSTMARSWTLDSWARPRVKILRIPPVLPSTSGVVPGLWNSRQQHVKFKRSRSPTSTLPANFQILTPDWLMIVAGRKPDTRHMSMNRVLSNAENSGKLTSWFILYNVTFPSSVCLDIHWYIKMITYNTFTDCNAMYKLNNSGFASNVKQFF